MSLLVPISLCDVFNPFIRILSYSLSLPFSTYFILHMYGTQYKAGIRYRVNDRERIRQQRRIYMKLPNTEIKTDMLTSMMVDYAVGAVDFG